MPGYTLPLYNPQKHTATKAAVITGACLIYAVLAIGDAEAAAFELQDALTDTGADTLIFRVLSGDTRLFDFSSMGGYMFGTGLSLTVTTGKLVIWTDKPQATA